MSTDCFALFLLTQTQLHAGAGSTLSVIDLPIQREVHSQHPVVWASGVKGALRDLAGAGSQRLSPEYEALFGPDTEAASDHGGLMFVVEARVILFPVAASDGIFWWVTCPLVLARLKRDFAVLHASCPNCDQAVNTFMGLSLPTLAPSTASLSGSLQGPLHFDAGPSIRTVPSDPSTRKLAEWLAQNALPSAGLYDYWRTHLIEHLAVVSDEEFRYLVTYATQVETHVKIGPLGTVEAGPWIEESLPADTLLMVQLTIPPPLEDKIIKKLANHKKAQLIKDLFRDRPMFQMCGGRSTGKGHVAPRLLCVSEEAR